MSKADLKVDWATNEAAAHACTKWHYTRSLPVGKTVKVGAWEAGRFIGVVLFAWGMNKDLGSPYGLALTECCELVRVALTDHKVQTSRVLSLALKFLKQSSPKIRLVVSFADPVQGHHGGIYQATNWIYSGQSAANYEYRLNGARLNKRGFTGPNFGKARMVIPAGAVRVALPGKHRYLYPLDEDIRSKVVLLSRPYPKRGGPDGPSGVHPEEGGLTPTPPLHLKRADV